MNAIELKANAVSELRFQIDVEGTTVPITDLRLSIVSESMIVSFKGVLKENVAVFKVRDAESFLPARKELPLQLEVFIGSQHFVPFVGKAMIVESARVSAQVAGEVVDQPTIVARLAEHGGKAVERSVNKRVFEKRDATKGKSDLVASIKASVLDSFMGREE